MTINAVNADDLLRMLVLPSAAPIQIIGNTTVSVPPVWPSKDPTEVLTYGLSFRNRIFNRTQIATVAPAQPGVMPKNAVVVSNMRVAGVMVLFQVSGGTNGQPATIPIKVQLTDGQVLTGVGTIPVIATEGAGSLINFPIGTYITDPATGAPLLNPVTKLPIMAPNPIGGYILDPDTGQAISDPTTGNTILPPSTLNGLVLDPATGLAVIDPNTGQPVIAPINAAGYVVDPNTGYLVKDPNTGKSIEAP